MEIFSQFGLTGLTLGILFFIVRYFVKTLESKDAYIQCLIKDHYEQMAALYQKYEKLTSEYISEGIESRSKHEEAFNNLSKCILGCPRRVIHD